MTSTCPFSQENVHPTSAPTSTIRRGTSDPAGPVETRLRVPRDDDMAKIVPVSCSTFPLSDLPLPPALNLDVE